MSIIYDMPQSVYRANRALGASDLKNLLRSPAYAFSRPDKPSDAKDFGTAMHTAILEPDQISVRYATDPEKPGVGGYPAGWRNTNQYKETKAELLAVEGRVGLLTTFEMLTLHKIADRLAKHPIGRKMRELEGHAEVSMFAPHEETGLERKIRPDFWIPEARTAIDLKSTADHRAWAFAGSIKRYGYHISEAYYRDVMAANDEDVDAYLHLAINSDAPHEIAFYALDRDSVEQGRFEAEKLLREWAEHEKSGIWPAGSDVIEEIRLPEWAIDFHLEGNIR